MLITDNNNYITTITIDREKYFNSLNSIILTELYEKIHALQKDSATKVIILTGSGDRAFVAGADIVEMSSFDSEEALRFAEQGHALMSAIEQSRKPVIAAINGFALGGGCELALACHIRYSSKNAVFGQPESGLGLIPGFGGTQRLARIVGYGRALEIMIRANKINADESYRIGLVNQVTEDDVVGFSKNIATEIVSNSSIAIKNIIQSSRYGFERGINHGLENEKKVFSDLFSTSDTKEGLSAFIEKRRPSFQ